MSHPASSVSFRPIVLVDGESDLPFLRALYASTRAEEMALSGWPQEQVDAFLGQQFEAQHKYYHEQFGNASFDLILGPDREPIGRLYLDQREDEFRIIDIALVPAWRGKGIGGRLLRVILGRAFSLGKAVRIHVEQFNPAMRLYQRLGFTMVEEQGVYHLLEAVPPASAKESAA